MHWLPIDSAPKDGTPILVIFESSGGREAVVVRYAPQYEGDSFVWVGSEDGAINEKYVHLWSPIPTFPDEPTGA